MPSLKKLLIVLLLGALAVAGYAPFYLYPITVAALAGLLYYWNSAENARQAAWLGFVFGLGFFGAGVYWIYISLHDFGGMPWWMAGFSTFVLCAFLSLFPAAVGWLAKRFSTSKPWLSIFAVPVLWALSEWVRSWIFTGFPWLAVGYSQVPFSPLAGFIPILGIYGVSLLTVLAAGLLLCWAQDKSKRLIVGLLIVGLWIGGSLLKLMEWTKPYNSPFSVALVQGNIAQDMKWDPEEAQRTIDFYFAQIKKSQADLIVLPETALPMLISQVPDEYLREITKHASQHQGDVLIGAVELAEDRYYNSMLSFGSSPTQIYRKSHLVPFGEFIPLKGIFGWIYRDWLNIPLTDLSRGGIDQQPLHIAGQRVAVNICYEDVFGEEIIRQLPAATILVNASNDAWYGESYAAHQHMQISQARALETGRMMLRATNTGATAIIDHKGYVVEEAPHFTTLTLTGKAQGFYGSTPYIKFGNWLFLAFSAAVLALLWGWKKK
ncbi:MAG TPA: apolipoprotein N-acyltransferase [Methylophilaceae bacterium]|nr:apolipoprotein N-acyltransferase [Methylophilaceae bacterium]